MEVWIISNFFPTVDKTIMNNSIYILIHTYGINTYKLNYRDIGYMYVKSLSWVWLFVTPWTVAHQVPWSMGFSRHEYWSGLPFPSPEDLPNTGIKPRSPALHADALPSELRGKPHNISLSLSFFWEGARILEWVAIPFSMWSSPPRDWTDVSHIVGRHFTTWATREVHHSLAPGK